MTAPAVVTAATIRSNAQVLLKADLPGVLQALATDLVPLPVPVTWRRLSDYTDIAEAQAPAVYVTSPGIDGTPSNDGRSTIYADWLVRAFAVVRGRDYEQTADRVAAYVAALRTVLLAHPSLGGLAQGREWVDESTTVPMRTDEDGERSIAAGSVTVRYLRIPTVTTVSPLVLSGNPDAPTALHVSQAVTVTTPPTNQPTP